MIVFNLVFVALCAVLMTLHLLAATRLRGYGAPRWAVLVREAAAIVCLVMIALVLIDLDGDPNNLVTTTAALSSIIATYLAPEVRYMPLLEHADQVETDS